LGTPERHLALGRLQYEGQTQAPPGAWVLVKDPIDMVAPPPRGARVRMRSRQPQVWSERVCAQPHVCLYNNVCYKYFFFLIIQSVHIKNIIICVLNIITFIITRSIDLKNIIICVVIILEILNIIIYVINIIIFIIINIINKIINKFEKHYY
jgi:hypothetical protein